MSGFDGAHYQARFDTLAAAGAEVHGEAVFVESLRPVTVLDAGCGTGRVAIELARRGIEVLGVDANPSMIAEARRRAPQLRWVEADLVGLDLGERFDAVVLAGNVPLFTRPGTEAALVGSSAAHVARGGVLVAGFELDKRYSLADYDAAAEGAGLILAERWATWDRRPSRGEDAYAVSVHRRPV
ncbi:MAG: class I SAM-dependent methyltransferase [Acidimicrobiales bacterium]